MPPATAEPMPNWRQLCYQEDNDNKSRNKGAEKWAANADAKAEISMD